jgi:hypothetical protein
MKIINTLTGLLFAAGLISLLSCHHNADLSVAPPKPTPPGSEFKCSHDTIYFKNSVLPVVLNGCARSGCHDHTTAKEELVLENYQEIVRLIVPFDPQNSELYIRLFGNSEGRMPPDVPLSMNDKSIIYWWIAQGGKNNGCDSIACDTTNVTYTVSLVPILQTWCVGCHSGSNPSHGLSLDTYDNVVACANSNRLMGAIRHETGYSPMPNGGGMLSPCEIDLFQKWIDLGMPQ